MLRFIFLAILLGGCGGRSLSLTPLAQETKPTPEEPALPDSKPLVFPSITLAWDANDPGENVQGYRIYHGQLSRDYNSVLDAGPATELHIPDLKYATTYYFTATAWNTVGESPFSDEVIYHSPGAEPSPPKEPLLSPFPDRIDVSGGSVGVTYYLQSSTDLAVWQDVREFSFDTEAHVVSLQIARPPGRIFFRVRWVK